jgi:hypothetical protein
VRVGLSSSPISGVSALCPETPRGVKQYFPVQRI